jgi:hypothetical protein
MKQKRFSTEQIVAALKQVELGLTGGPAANVLTVGDALTRVQEAAMSLQG